MNEHRKSVQQTVAIDNDDDGDDDNDDDADDDDDVTDDDDDVFYHLFSHPSATHPQISGVWHQKTRLLAKLPCEISDLKKGGLTKAPFVRHSLQRLAMRPNASCNKKQFHPEKRQRRELLRRRSEPSSAI